MVSKNTFLRLFHADMDGVLQTLTHRQFRLYCLLLREYRGPESNGRLFLTYEQAKKHKLSNKQRFYRDLKVLEEKGLIQKRKKPARGYCAEWFITLADEPKEGIPRSVTSTSNPLVTSGSSRSVTPLKNKPKEMIEDNTETTESVIETRAERATREAKRIRQELMSAMS